MSELLCVETAMKHVDDFVSFPPDDDAGRYAAFCFMIFRLPAVMKMAFGKWTNQFRLFCTYEGKRYRVTGASRMGDVWLAEDFEQDCGYDLRVDLAECTEWSDTHNGVFSGTPTGGSAGKQG